MPPNTGALPVRLSPLVGRDNELSDIARALSGSRLLTLTGPGGTGKTRLALAAAQADAQTDTQACWVELAPIDDPELVPQAVASRLGVPDTPGQEITEAIATTIAGQRILLVLDNCEHLTQAAADLTEWLLAACPALVVLATSREALGVEGERTWPVPVLPTSDAVRLFEQRAQLVRPGFTATDDVTRICQRLDGLPLAIELAAARMRILDSAQLAERLDDIFAVLTGGARSAPPRHQALRATLDWSHDLLGKDERALFRRLAVFSGGFTLDAAEQVAAGDGIEPAAMLDLLTRLADKSLLRVEHGHGSSRFGLLATIWDYARERLAQAGESDLLRDAHLRYYTELADNLDLDQLEMELPNLRSAFEYAPRSADPVTALRLAGSLVEYASLRGHYHEVRQWLDIAVTSCPDAPEALRAKALLGGGRLALLQCDYAPAIRRGEAALRLYRDLADARGIASSLQLLGSVAREQGRYARAAELYAESLAGAQAAGDRRSAASVNASLAFVHWLQRDYDGAIAAASTALETYRALEDVEGMASSLIHLGTVARYKNSAERAVVLLTEARTLAEGIGFREGIAWTLEQLGLLSGDVDMLRRSLEMHTELRDRWRSASLLEDLASVAVAGHPARAARLLGAAEAIRDAIGSVIPPCDRAQHEATVAAAELALGEAAFTAAQQQGQLSTAEDLRADLPRAGARAADNSTAVPILRGLPTSPAMQAGPTLPAMQEGPTSPATPPGPIVAAAPVVAAPVAVGAAEPVAALRIRTLGDAVVSVNDTALTAADWGYAKPRELLFLLASSPPMTKEQIGAALWPDLARAQLGNALHTALRELRRAVGDPGWVVYADRHYRFDRSRRHACDVTDFEDALIAARRASPAAGALPDLQRAIAAYGGDFLDGMAAGEWALVRRDELRRAFESALLAAGRLQVAAGRHQAAAACFRRAVAHEPLNESAHRELMTCWERLGETARAVRHYEELAQRLHDQLGVAPAPETTALYRKLAAQ
jgi:predicted ATPase/DNA-binding SARP family transcriptional activator